MDVWMDGWKGERIGGCEDESVKVWMDGWMDGCHI